MCSRSSAARRMVPGRPCLLLGALGGGEELAQLLQVVLSETCERRDDLVSVLRGVRDVVGEVLRAAVAGTDRGQVRCAQVRRAGAEIRVALAAADLREDLRARDRRLVVLEALALRPDRHGL